MSLLRAGCSFLWVMSDEAGAHRSRLLAGGAVAAVLAVLRAHGVRAAEAAWPALGFLWNVSQDASTRPDIAAGDGIELGMSSAAAHVRNQDVVLAGAWLGPAGRRAPPPVLRRALVTLARAAPRVRFSVEHDRRSKVACCHR